MICTNALIERHASSIPPYVHRHNGCMRNWLYTNGQQVVSKMAQIDMISEGIED